MTDQHSTAPSLADLLATAMAGGPRRPRSPFSLPLDGLTALAGPKHADMLRRAAALSLAVYVLPKDADVFDQQRIADYLDRGLVDEAPTCACQTTGQATQPLGDEAAGASR